MKIAVFMGGTSREREVSLATGNAILKGLVALGYNAYGVDIDNNNYIDFFNKNTYDVAFMALHGTNGEDGKSQAILDSLGKKYTGSGTTASAVAFDKELTKIVAKNEGITIPETYKSIDEVKTYPVVVKPVAEGSSVGLYICKNEGELEEALKKLSADGEEPMVEEYIQGEELTVGVLAGEELGVLKIKPKSGVYDYHSKYTKGETIYEYPAKIPEELYKRACNQAKLIHKKLKLKGASRSDFLLKGDKIYFLEVNTCPGMTETSLIPKLGTLKNYTFNDIIEEILKDIS